MDVVEFLLENGASVNAQDNVSINSEGKYGIDLKVYKVIQWGPLDTHIAGCVFACYRYCSSVEEKVREFWPACVSFLWHDQFLSRCIVWRWMWEEAHFLRKPVLRKMFTNSQRLDFLVFHFCWHDSMLTTFGSNIIDPNVNVWLKSNKNKVPGLHS